VEAEQDQVVTQVHLAEKLQTVMAVTDTFGGEIIHVVVVAVVVLVDLVHPAVADLALVQTLAQQAMAPLTPDQVLVQVILAPEGHWVVQAL
jgi:hypothetical protein